MSTNVLRVRVSATSLSLPFTGDLFLAQARGRHSESSFHYSLDHASFRARANTIHKRSRVQVPLCDLAVNQQSRIANNAEQR